MVDPGGDLGARDLDEGGGGVEDEEGDDDDADLPSPQQLTVPGPRK